MASPLWLPGWVERTCTAVLLLGNGDFWTCEKKGLWVLEEGFKLRDVGANSAACSVLSPDEPGIAWPNVKAVLRFYCRLKLFCRVLLGGPLRL